MKINYLDKSTIPDIVYDFYQFDTFSSYTKVENSEGVEFLVNYLEVTNDKGIIMNPICIPYCKFILMMILV